MNHNHLSEHPVLEKIRQSKALSITARIAPSIDELNELVLTRLMTWQQVAVAIGVEYQSLQSARRRVSKMQEKWAIAGIRPAAKRLGDSGAPRQTKKLKDYADSQESPAPLSGFAKLPDYED